MKRRTLKQLRPNRQPELHHSVYVVLLDPAVGKLRKVRAENPKRDPKKPCVYVGLTGLTPEERFANHKAGDKDAYVVNRYGIRLLPDMFAHLNPMPYEAAAKMEDGSGPGGGFAPGGIHRNRRALRKPCGAGFHLSGTYSRDMRLATGYIKSMIDGNKSVHEQVIYQSDTERSFAEQLEMNEAIKVYAKLPGWF